MIIRKGITGIMSMMLAFNTFFLNGITLLAEEAEPASEEETQKVTPENTGAMQEQRQQPVR